MLTCIACSKQQLADGGDDTARRTTSTSTKPAVKSLTSQIKDVVLKLSGAYRSTRPNGPKGPTHHRSHGVVDYDYTSETGGDCGHEWSSYPYVMGKCESSSSTPAWDFDPLKINGRNNCKEEELKEWVAQVEPGVHVTFLALPHGGNDLKRIRFDREKFNKWEAQRWWGENYDRIMELYNVQKFNRQALPTPPRFEDEIQAHHSRAITSPLPPPFPNHRSRGVGGGKEAAPDPTEYFFPHHQAFNHVMLDTSRTTTSSRDDVASASISNASDLLLEATEWVEEDEPGVYVTIRLFADGSRDLRRVRFSRERFGEVNAKLWWEENRDRIHAQYL